MEILYGCPHRRSVLTFAKGAAECFTCHTTEKGRLSLVLGRIVLGS